MSKRSAALAALAILAIVASACNLPLTPVPGRGGTPAAAVPNTGGAGAPQIFVAKHGKYGKILVDASGRTLYMYTKDGPDTPTCYGACAKLWPPFLSTTGSVAAQQAITVIRRDGSRQVVFDGHPLYYYSKDAGPGNVKGEGINRTWYVISPAGKPVEK
jgi:predicted lipoprotein with Yx(FWY)xxD motif